MSYCREFGIFCNSATSLGFCSLTACRRMNQISNGVVMFADLREKRMANDAVERKRGRWIKMSDADGIYFACSICGENLPRVIQRFDPQFDLFPRLESIDKTNYCPNCGADMRGEAND